MILSDRHRFAFLHNPKVGGTSVRATIERFHDVEPAFWGVDSNAAGPKRDRAHLGLDEIATLYPEIWERMQGYTLYCLYRDPWERFFSSLSEFSKLHGETDTRFADAHTRKKALEQMVTRLTALGQAEATLEEYDLRHFRPQWIYWHAGSAPEVEVTALPVARLDALFEAISTRSGETLAPQTRNRGDQLSLPGPLARLAGQRRMRDMLKRLPGAGGLKATLRRHFSASGRPEERFSLDASEQREIKAFVNRFYARDLALWPDRDAASPAGNA